jgi:hypothetical protein
LQQASTLAEVGNARSVVMVEHLVAQDCVSNLRRMHEVHLEQTSLKVGLLRLVIFESI